MSERSGGMSGHTSPINEKDEWLTPRWVLTLLGAPDAFDLDPCAAPDPRPWPTAKRMIVRAQNGLLGPWEGSVWLNPPYGGPSIVGPWMRRMAAHGDGVALIFARTETDIFHQTVWGRASAVFFFRGRLFFSDSEGKTAANNAGAPSVLVAYGPRWADALAERLPDDLFAAVEVAA